MTIRRNIIWYHPNLKEHARDLRKNPTKTEKLLWEKLKGRQLLGYDFHRQKPIAYFIVDFYCCELKLAIEIDGTIHEIEDQKNRDKHRQEILENYGISIIRFSNDEIFTDINKVITMIKRWVKLNK